MMNEGNQTESTADTTAELLLQQLMQLKRYETPETARMTRNKQNIMREVRTAKAGKRKSIGDLLEVSIPWFFAEPKYGVAALFVAFVALQYLGMSARNSARSTGIYTTTDNFAAFEPSASVSTNRTTYPTLPSNYPLFNGQQNQSDIRFVERLEPK
ncbi:MAG: hypothetical protein HKP10_01385 [Kiritimatiellales bacterium]|nr:hypothetical protein [Pontiella sp.]NNJ69923.1 hypothetical protein [Kiritimatiellales bacterium]